MKLIGITGGIGMGKSTAGDILRQRGVAIADTDLIARQLVEPGQLALEEIQRQFGAGVLLPDGRLSRHELARQVFGDVQVRRQLEGILHPRIRAAWEGQARQWRIEGRALGAVIIPLLFETKAASLFDAVVCVACSAATQAQRLHDRGWGEHQTRQRLDAQWPVERKIAQADFVVWTDTTREVHAAQLARVVC